MKQKLTIKEYIFVASMLFGLFFGAGNLIFPVSMGQQAGQSYPSGRSRILCDRRGTAAFRDRRYGYL